MSNARALPRARLAKCMCRTVWQVDRGDEWLTVPANRAAFYSTYGLAVRLVSVSTSPLKPLVIPGLIYTGDREYASEVCKVCGYPTRLDPVPRPAPIAK